MEMATRTDSHEATPPAKRKRSLSEHPPARLHIQPAAPSSQYRLEINYLARQDSRDLPVVSNALTVRDILDTLYKYAGVLERNESVAANLGCKPLGPILMKRFERLFDGPVVVLNAPDVKINWWRVSELARQRPADFRVIEKNGNRVCAFHIDGYDAEISEEDYQILASGMADNIMPPQPIEEDEDKELKILEDLVHSLSEVIRDADAISGFGRQVKHRFEQRKGAILSKKETAAAAAANVANGQRPVNTIVAHSPPAPQNRPYHPPATRPASNTYPAHSGPAWSPPTTKPFPAKQAQVESPVMQNGFRANHAEAQAPSGGHEAHGASSPYGADVLLKAAAYSRDYSHSPVQHAQQTPDKSPFRAEIVARVEAMEKGTEIYPPCDRCRRLNQPCRKNLSACDGCTKKHAKCNWEKVLQEEMDQGRVSRPSPAQTHPIVKSIEDGAPAHVHENPSSITGKPPDLA